MSFSSFFTDFTIGTVIFGGMMWGFSRSHDVDEIALGNNLDLAIFVSAAIITGAILLTYLFMRNAER